MAIINKSGIDQGLVISSEHITRIIDSLDGTGLYTIAATGSFTGSFAGAFSGSVTATPLLLVRGEAQIAPTGSVTTEASHLNFRNKGQNYISHASTAGFTLFRNDSANLMILTGSYIGIGTDNPQSMFHINSTASPSTGEQLMRFTVSDDATAGLFISNGTGTNGVFSPTITGRNSSTTVPAIGIDGQSITDSGTEPSIRFSARNANQSELLTKPLFGWYNYGTEKMRMTAGGNVGINTSSPASLLHVNGVLTVGNTSNFTSSLSFGGLTYINSEFHNNGGGSIMQFRGHTGGSSNVLLMSLTGSTGDLVLHNGAVKAANFNYRDTQGRPSSASFITPVREYTAPISAVSSSNWRPICVVRGGSLGLDGYQSAANGITLRLSGTTGSVIVNVSAEITTNHRGDVFIKSISGDYTQVKLKVEAGYWNNFNVYAKALNLSNPVNLEAYVIPHFRNEVVFASTSTSTGSFITEAEEYVNSPYDWTVVEHHCSPGLAISNTDADSYTDSIPSSRMSNIKTIGSVFIGATPTGSALPSAKLHVVNNLDETPSLLVQDSNPDASPFIIDNAGKVGIGTATPIASVHVTADAVVGGEQIARFGTNDDAVSAISIENSTGTAAQFVPMIQGLASGSPNQPGLQIISRNYSDTAGSHFPGMVFTARSSSNSTQDLRNKPLFSWGNASSQYMFMNANGNLSLGDYTAAGAALPSIAAKLLVNGEAQIAATGSSTTVTTHFNYENKGQNFISHGSGQGYTLFRSGSTTTMYLTGSYVSIGQAYNPLNGAANLTDNSSPLMVSNSIDIRGAGTTASLFLKSGDGTVRHYISGYCSTGAGNEHLYIGTRYNDIHFQTSGQNPQIAGTRLFISASGNVGIGNTDPKERLHISAQGVGTAANETSWAQRTDIASGTKLYQGAVRTELGTDYQTLGLRLQAQQDSTWQGFIQFNGGGAQNGLQFGTGTSTVNANAIPIRMTINSDGNVGIGTAVQTYQLQLSNNSAAKPTSEFWTIQSDMRLKDNIEEANYETCYNIINSLPLKRYTWKPEVFTTEQVADRSKLGWIAQDVESIFPKAITTASFFGPGSLTSGSSFISGSILSGSYDGFYLEDCKHIDNNQIYAAMYGTIKYLIAENNTLKNDIAAIKAELGL